MAEGFARHFGGSDIEAESAGSRPSGKVNSDAVRVMEEAGVDLSGHTSKSVETLSGKTYDYVVTMGCGDVCPSVPAAKRLDWEIPDPKGKDLATFRKVRDMISGKVRTLLEEIKSSREF